VCSRGGNASNSCTVLAELKVPAGVDFFGSMADGAMETAIVEKDFAASGIDFSSSVQVPNCVCPNSMILISEATGSRTIVHTNKDLPEPTAEQFERKVDLSQYDWIHFEGRNKDEVKLMAERVRAWREGFNQKLIISVEVEKVGRNFEELIPYGDVVFISKDMARAHGAKSAEDALRVFRPQLSAGSTLVVPWGDVGAGALDERGEVVFSPAFPPKGGLVDTVGAGDTFIGAFVGAKRSGLPLAGAVRAACRVAGAKVGRRGFAGLKDVYRLAILEEDGK